MRLALMLAPHLQIVQTLGANSVRGEITPFLLPARNPGEPQGGSHLGDTERDRIFAIMRQKNSGMAQIQHMLGMLREAADLIPDFATFEWLCAQNLRQAWNSDRLTGKRELHNRRRAWLRLFRHFAPLHGLQTDIRIHAKDRTGGYLCELIPKPERGPVWRDFVLRAREFGIYERELEGLAIRAEKRKPSGGVVGRGQYSAST